MNNWHRIKDCNTHPAENLAFCEDRRENMTQVAQWVAVMRKTRRNAKEMMQ